MKNITRNKKWHVLITKSRFEKKIANELEKNGFEICFPIRKELRFWSDRKKWIDVPIFKSYIFINIETHNKHKVFGPVGLLKYLAIGKETAILKPNDIENIKLLNESSEPIELSYKDYEKGEKVQILSGNFRGLQGELIENGRKNRIKIRIEGLDCYANIFIEKSVVTRILS